MKRSVVDSVLGRCQPLNYYHGFIILFCFQVTSSYSVFGFGILFTEFLQNEGSSATTIATIYNVMNFVYVLIPVLGGPLSSVFGWRVVAFGSSMLMFCGWLISAFATSANVLFFSYSLITGKISEF